jgi:hypothetical protein
MYGIVFTSILVLILLLKVYFLIKNKKNSSSFENMDDELVIMLNEGDSIE